MPKMRTHKGMKKRFKKTGSGHIKRSQAGTSHLAPGKTQKRLRHLRKASVISASDLKRIKKQLAVIK